MKPFAPQDGKDGCRVGAAHGGGQQQASHHTQAEARVNQEIEYQPGNYGGKQHAQGSQCYTWTQYWLDVFNLGVESSRKQDGTQSHGANHVRQLDVVEVDAESIAAEQHPHAEKQQQGRHAETAACLARQDAGKE